MTFDYKAVIKKEFIRRKMTNSAYSLRAFARDLGLSAPQLSGVLSGKKGLSIERARSVGAALELSKNEMNKFLTSVSASHGRSRTERENSLMQMTMQQNSHDAAFSTVQEARFEIISEWHHLAILHLSDTEGFEWNDEKIASRLGIEPTAVEQSIASLERVGLLRTTEHGYEKTEEFITTDDIPSRAIRFYHQQMMGKAIKALDDQPREERDFSTILLALQASRLPELKERLRQIAEEFCVEATRGAHKDQVYALGIQFYKVTR